MTRVQLKADGCIVLGNHVSCDGFAWQRPVRVQTHVHADHMVNFDTSKANQQILTSGPTRDILFALYNADLPYRSNITALQPGEPYSVNGDLIELFPSNHMLGSVQVKVTCSDSFRVGYSSDFFWPMDDVIEVDELVVDATYGDPLCARRYGQEQVDDALLSVVSTNLRAGKPTAIIGHNGRLQYALHLLSEQTRCPVVCSPRAFPLVDVYRRHGYASPDVILADSPEAIHIIRNRELSLAFVTLSERRHLPWVDRYSKVVLSGYMASPKHPLMLYDNGDCCLALTDHADFEGTLSYVRATGAKQVWTDPRSGNAEALADAIANRLGVECHAAREVRSFGWG